jgi:hypothetical protein
MDTAADLGSFEEQLPSSIPDEVPEEKLEQAKIDASDKEDEDEIAVFKQVIASIDHSSIQSFVSTVRARRESSEIPIECKVVSSLLFGSYHMLYQIHGSRPGQCLVEHCRSPHEMLYSDWSTVSSPVAPTRQPRQPIIWSR